MAKILIYLSTALLFAAAVACGSETGNSTVTNSPNSIVSESGNTAENTDDGGTPVGASGGVESEVTPESVVAELYKAHDGKKSPFFQTKDRALVDKFFVKETADLIWRDAKESAENNSVGALGFDPLYDGQDFDIKNFKITPGNTKDDISTVAANFTNFGQKNTVTFLLRRSGDKWKIEDIRYLEAGTLLKMLREHFSQPKDEVGETPASFQGQYRVGTTECNVQPVKTAFHVRWTKGKGFEKFEFKEGTTFESNSEDGKNRFVFEDSRYDKGTFHRADGKTFPVERAK